MPYAVERGAEWRDSRRTPWPYQVTPEWEHRVHDLAGGDWPCEELVDFADVWNATLTALEARGLQVGRLTFGRWDDGDPALAQLGWCLARRLVPRKVVETGVARGLTTRVLLEALERNAHGRLWSIDLPPFSDTRSHEIGAAVPGHLHERWALLPGASRQLLPGLLADLGQIDLFVHDSSHTTRNVRFELEHVWPSLAPGGAVLVDDLEKNRATGEFLRTHSDAAHVVAPSHQGGC
jgi:hypothetical protein